MIEEEENSKYIEKGTHKTKSKEKLHEDRRRHWVKVIASRMGLVGITDATWAVLDGLSYYYAILFLFLFWLNCQNG